MSIFEMSAASKAALDRVCALAERNGWNAAINACRQALPPEQSVKLRGLYKLDDTTPMPPAERERPL